MPVRHYERCMRQARVTHFVLEQVIVTDLQHEVNNEERELSSEEHCLIFVIISLLDRVS